VFAEVLTNFDAISRCLRKKEAVSSIGAKCPEPVETRWVYQYRTIEFILSHASRVPDVLGPSSTLLHDVAPLACLLDPVKVLTDCVEASGCHHYNVFPLVTLALACYEHLLERDCLDITLQTKEIALHLGISLFSICLYTDDCRIFAHSYLLTPEGRSTLLKLRYAEREESRARLAASPPPELDPVLDPHLLDISTEEALPEVLFERKLTPLPILFATAAVLLSPPTVSQEQQSAATSAPQAGALLSSLSLHSMSGRVAQRAALGPPAARDLVPETPCPAHAAAPFLEEAVLTGDPDLPLLERVTRSTAESDADAALIRQMERDSKAAAVKERASQRAQRRRTLKVNPEMIEFDPDESGDSLFDEEAVYYRRNARMKMPDGSQEPLAVAGAPATLNLDALTEDPVSPKPVLALPGPLG
jgi:hypothetical protein